jgi:hypothetical protein
LRSLAERYPVPNAELLQSEEEPGHQKTMQGDSSG